MYDLIEASEKLDEVMQTCGCMSMDETCPACKLAGHISSLIWRVHNAGDGIPVPVRNEVNLLSKFLLDAYYGS